MSKFNNICDKLRPYVGSALKERPEPSEKDNEFAKDLLSGLYYSFGISITLEELHKVDDGYIDLCTDLITATWSDTLGGAYKEQGEIKLRDCLLPDNLGRYKRAWDHNLNMTGLPQEQAEDMLRKFGQKEISDKLELPSGLYVKRVEEGYELRGK